MASVQCPAGNVPASFFNLIKEKCDGNCEEGCGEEGPGEEGCGEEGPGEEGCGEEGPGEEGCGEEGPGEEGCEEGCGEKGARCACSCGSASSEDGIEPPGCMAVPHGHEAVTM
jgi:hypothetical protein